MHQKTVYSFSFRSEYYSSRQGVSDASTSLVQSRQAQLATAVVLSQKATARTTSHASMKLRSVPCELQEKYLNANRRAYSHICRAMRQGELSRGDLTSRVAQTHYDWLYRDLTLQLVETMIIVKASDLVLA